MNITDFLATVKAIRENCGLKCVFPNYYIFIHNGLKRATVNHTGFLSMADVEYVIAVSAYQWTNLGYTNTSLTQLAVVDNKFEPVEGIEFGDWTFKGLDFTRHYGNYYNAWKPFPKLELTSDPSINNYEPRPAQAQEWGEEYEKMRLHDWKSSIEDMTGLLKEIHEFTETYKK